MRPEHSGFAAPLAQQSPSPFRAGIHYVPWEELIQLEKGREGQVRPEFCHASIPPQLNLVFRTLHPPYPPAIPQVINFKARLVGNEGLLSNNGMMGGSPRISSDAGMRCNNCPSRGCANCPMCVHQGGSSCNLISRHSPHTHMHKMPLPSSPYFGLQVWGWRQPRVCQKENEERQGSERKSPETGTGRIQEGDRPLDAPLVARLHHQVLPHDERMINVKWGLPPLRRSAGKTRYAQSMCVSSIHARIPAYWLYDNSEFSVALGGGLQTPRATRGELSAHDWQSLLARARQGTISSGVKNSASIPPPPSSGP